MEAAAELAVLMTLRVRGRAEASQVARGTGWTEADALRALGDLRSRSLVVPVGGTDAVGLTDAGRAGLAALLAGEPIDRAALAVAYASFLAVDRTLKRAITAWQLTEPSAKSLARGAVTTAAGEAEAVARTL